MLENKKFYKIAFITPEEHKMRLNVTKWSFPGGAVVKNLPANAGETGSIPGLGRSHMPWSN